jgi:hypothetical protein
MARLVVDAVFRDAVRAKGDEALMGELTSLERQRLVAIAVDRGLDATRMLYKGFRLSKLYATLPLTCALLGEKRLGREADVYWASRVSVSLYYFEEAFGFCDHLQERLKAGLRVMYLDEVLGYERASLELQRPRGNGDSPGAYDVEFQHDPEILLNSLARGKRPRAVPKLRCSVRGRATKDEGVEWHFLSDDLRESRNRGLTTRRRVIEARKQHAL